jgi:hypothetical protein
MLPLAFSRGDHHCYRSNFLSPVTPNVTPSVFFGERTALGLPRKILILKAERVKGIEPSSSAWKAVALPLSYTRARGQLSEVSNQVFDCSPS